MDRVIELIQLAVNELLQYRIVEYEQYSNEMISAMFETFPQMIAIYTDERLSDIASDAKYWPTQLEKIIKTMEGEDDFAVADVLYNETLPNIMEFRSVLVERGIL